MEIKVGDIYEACDYHPVLCTEVDYDDDHIMGVSLIDGSLGHGCSLTHCGVFKMTVEEALASKAKWTERNDSRISA